MHSVCITASSLTIIPTTIIAIVGRGGLCRDPVFIIGLAIGATAALTITAIIADRASADGREGLMEGLALLLQVLSRWVSAHSLPADPLYGYLKGVAVCDTFVEGARGRCRVAVRLLPYLVAMFAAIEILGDRGAMDAWWASLPSIIDSLKIFWEVLPLALILLCPGRAL